MSKRVFKCPNCGHKESTVGVRRSHISYGLIDGYGVSHTSEGTVSFEATCPSCNKTEAYGNVCVFIELATADASS